jgi:acetyltransferase-like isoleucine patch superfamily enzyme
MNQLRQHTKITFYNRLRVLLLNIKGLKIDFSVYLGNNIFLGRYLDGIAIGSSVILKDGCHICTCNKDSQVSIGDNTSIGFYTLIYSSESIIIGNNCSIAPFVYVVDSNHSYLKNMFINEQPNVCEKIEIKDDVWIGAGCIILKGVIIGKGSVVAANSVVNCSIPEYEIWGGVPAKKIKDRL